MIDRDDLAKLMYVNEHGETPGFKAFAIDGLFEVGEAGTTGAPTAAGGQALRRALDDVRRRVSEAIADGANLIVLVGPQLDRRVGAHPVAAADGERCTTTWCARRRARRSGS